MTTTTLTQPTINYMSDEYLGMLDKVKNPNLRQNLEYCLHYFTGHGCTVIEGDSNNFGFHVYYQKTKLFTAYLVSELIDITETFAWKFKDVIGASVGAVGIRDIDTIDFVETDKDGYVATPTKAPSTKAKAKAKTTKQPTSKPNMDELLLTITNATSYRTLQSALKVAKAAKLVDVKLNGTYDTLIEAAIKLGASPTRATTTGKATSKASVIKVGKTGYPDSASLRREASAQGVDVAKYNFKSSKDRALLATTLGWNKETKAFA